VKVHGEKSKAVKRELWFVFFFFFSYHF